MKILLTKTEALRSDPTIDNIKKWNFDGIDEAQNKSKNVDNDNNDLDSIASDTDQQRLIESPKSNDEGNNDNENIENDEKDEINQGNVIISDVPDIIYDYELRLECINHKFHNVVNQTMKCSTSLATDISNMKLIIKKIKKSNKNYVFLSEAKALKTLTYVDYIIYILFDQYILIISIISF